MIKQSKRLKDIHSSALTLFDGIYRTSYPERAQALQERRFGTIPGAQWEGPLQQQFQNKPRLEVNLTHLALIRVQDEWLNNRITVDFVAKNGDEDDLLADACDGLYRADEQDSGAQEAYDNAVAEAIGGGMGAFRLRAAYEDEYDEDNTHQRIRIEPIYDADQTVYFDLNAKRQDKADAKHCFVLTGMTREAYEDDYGDEVDTWPQPTQWKFEWRAQDTIYVAEYYKVVEKSEMVYTFTDITGEEERLTESEMAGDDEDPEAAIAAYVRDQKAIGTKVTSKKRCKSRRVHKFILSGSGVLEDQGLLPGKHIPIIPVYGKRWYIDNIERFMGHVRLAQDSQRLFNMQLSKVAEDSAMSSVGKPILTPEQIGPHAAMWAKDGVENYPYLLINPVVGPDGTPQPLGPVGTTTSPDIPPARAALLQIAQQSLSDLLGSAQAPEEIVSNTSGKAVNMTQQRQDARAFIYMSNAGKGIRRSGEVWLEMAKELYCESGRKMKTVSSQGAYGSVEISRPVVDKEGVTTLEYDMSKAACDVTVDIGPTSSSKRAALVQALTGVLQVTTDPEQATVLTAMILRNVEGEGLHELHEYERKKLLAMGIGEPTDADKAEAANAQPAPPDPNAQFLLASAEKEASTAALNRAKIPLTQAQTVAELADAHQKAQTNVTAIHPGTQGHPPGPMGAQRG